MFGGYSGSSGDERPAPQFVAGNYSGGADSDDDMFGGEPDMAVLTRSSPTPNLLAVAPVARAADVKQEMVSYDGMADVEYSATVKTVMVSTVSADDDPAGGFSSISDRFPLSKVGKVSCGKDKRVLCIPLEPKRQIAAPIPMSRLLNATPEMTQPDQMTVLMEGDVMGDGTIKAEPATVFEPVAGTNQPPASLPTANDLYRYQASDVEENEMEQLRWNIQEQVFQRYFQLGQKHQEWGKLEEQDNIAHYDLKPSNILIDQDGCVKLTDFDLTRSAKEPTSNSTVGTLRYLPPECFRPSQGDCEATAEKADMWMVGIVYCMMVTGKHPICSEKSSHADVKAAMAQYSGELRYARPISDLSRWIFQGCLHPDPRCRPTAAQLLVALQSAAQQQQ
ncbi:hypothetical protein BBJ28_00010087 [Nothophytophthora sp. Chile5]|nr:hypothetical protein BBJ28_00010087 [Nothophytophthora sp. Chile5]